MAVPKRKVSRARRDKRRGQVWKLNAPAFSRCTNCGELKSLIRFVPTAVIIRAGKLLLTKLKLLKIKG